MHYIISDIHGEFDSFLRMMDQIKFSDQDRMFLLGDVIDRGKQSIQLLRFIHKNPNIIFMIGNHEDMMLKALKRQGNNLLEIAASPEMKRWNRNGGMATLEQWIGLESDEQAELLSFLEESWLVYPQLEVENKFYYLVHACPGEDYYSKPLKYKDAKDDEVHQMLWDRRCMNDWKLPENLRKYEKDTTIFFGHTKTNSFMDKFPSQIHYFQRQNAFDIDCCGQLGCYCIEKKECFYVESI